MDAKEIERIKGGVERALQLNADNQILKDLKAAILDLEATYLQVSELRKAIDLAGQEIGQNKIKQAWDRLSMALYEHPATDKPNPEPCGSVDTAYDHPCQMGKGHAGVHRATTVYEWGEAREKRLGHNLDGDKS